MLQTLNDSHKKVLSYKKKQHRSALYHLSKWFQLIRSVSTWELLGDWQAFMINAGYQFSKAKEKKKDFNSCYILFYKYFCVRKMRKNPERVSRKWYVSVRITYYYNYTFQYFLPKNLITYKVLTLFTVNALFLRKNL